MGPVPAWTKEWRPLVKQLCAFIDDSYGANQYNCLSRETILLRADRVIGQLYAHQFVDSLPKDVQTQTQALATKFRVHSLDDRADKLLQLAPQCDYQVLKLLLTLAKSPTTASDEAVAVDPNSHSKWKTVLDEAKARQKEKEMMQNQLIEELFQIATNDEWYQAWNSSEEEEEGEEEEEEESDWEISSVDDKASLKQPMGMSLDSRVKDLLGNGTEREEKGGHRLKTMEKEGDQETMQNEIMCQYYSQVSVNNVDKVDDPTCELKKIRLVPFTFERPWLLCEAVVKENKFAADKVRLIHEESVVSMIFEALDGVDSLLFECRAVIPKPSLFSLEFQTHVVERSPHSLNVAVGHLSPLAFQHVLDEFAIAASDLHALRDFLEFVRQARYFKEHHQCGTIQGLANSLSEIMRTVMKSIRSVESETSIPAGSEEDPRPWSRLTPRQPTLLGIYGGLKDIFKLISWLKRVLMKSFDDVSGRHWHKVKRAELAKCVLDSLYHMMEVEYVENVAIDANVSSASGFSRSDVLLHLFEGALNPYLDLMNRKLFDVGYFKTIPLDDELFFVNVGISTTSRRPEKFEAEILSLAPFDVNRSLVPTFLESKIDLMKEAIASRQMTNQFIQHEHQHGLAKRKELKQRHLSLRKLLRTELETIGCRNLGDPFSLQNSGDGLLIPSQHMMLACAPLNRILTRCLTKHIETKCLELNGELADIFRDQLEFMEHVESLRMFVLMEQQDVFKTFSEKIVAHMQANPVIWADSEAIHSFHQSAIQQVDEEKMLSSSPRQFGTRLCVRVDFSLLDTTSSTAGIDIATIKCIYFTFSVPPPLGVLFSTSIMQKYSRLGVLLVQVKAVESVLVKFKSTIRHRCCFTLLEADLRQVLVQIADMLHYTKSLLSYLTSQISSGKWAEHRQILQTSRSLTEMNATHEKYLDDLLTRFFLLEKHATVFQYILTTFNHILRFVGHVDEFVSMVDRNMHEYVTKYRSGESKTATIRLLDHPDFHLLRAAMTTSSSEYKRQAHFLVVMLTSMKKYDASSHVTEMLTHLNFNYFYH